MNINVSNAVNLFFPNPSLESVYFEAVANSVDANATKIWIDIKITDFNDVSSFIDDNGDKQIPWGLFVQSYESFLNDAEAQNATFLKILKEGFKDPSHA